MKRSLNGELDMTASLSPITTFCDGRYVGVQTDADNWTHLASVDTSPGNRLSLCGYTSAALRESTRRDLTHGRGLCPTCVEIGWGT